MPEVQISEVCIIKDMSKAVILYNKVSYAEGSAQKSTPIITSCRLFCDGVPVNT